MKTGKFVIISALLLASAVILRADQPVFNETVVGARAFSMSNSFTALADDFSAVYWNPAGLGFLPIRQVQFGGGGLQGLNRTSFGGNEISTETSRLRFDHAGLVRAIPTSQGGFAFAVGIIAPTDLDFTYSFKGTDTFLGNSLEGFYYDVTPRGDTLLDVLNTGDDLTYEQSDFRTYGSLYHIPLSAGWQIAPSFAFGATVSPIVGHDQQLIRIRSRFDDDKLFQNSTEEISRSFRGITARCGLLYVHEERLRAGLRIELPQVIALDQEYVFIDESVREKWPFEDNAKMVTRWYVGGGLAVRLPFITVSGDASVGSPFPLADERSLLSRWRGRGSVGVEVPIPFTPLLVRGGYSLAQLDPTPYQIEWEGDIEPRALSYFEADGYVQGITGGLGVMIKDKAILEAGYGRVQRSFFSHNDEWRKSVHDILTYHRALVSLSIRY